MASSEWYYFKNYHSDYLFKVLLIGNSGVGKSCFLMRFSVLYNNFFFFKGKLIHQSLL